jgi:signal transduction histidine kinase
MAADARAPHHRRWRSLGLHSVRVRTTAVAVLVVGLATVLGAGVLVALFQDSLLGELETAARLRAAEIAAGVESRAGLRTLGDGEDILVQLIDAEGRVTASSPNLAGLPVLARPAPDEATHVNLSIGKGAFLAVTTAVDTAAGGGTVLVALSTEPVAESTTAIAGLVATGVPLMLLVVAATTWLVVGRALAPVEAIRREVAAISAAQLHRRVPDPPGDDEITRLAHTMNGMLGRLECSRARQQRFVSDASHELRSPVATIRHYAEVALAHPERSAVTELAENVLAEDLRIQRLVSDMLLLARADEEQSAMPRPRPVDLDDVVFAAARDLKAGTRLRVNTSAVSPARVAGDAAALRRMLGNVVDNAARHARGRVAFALAVSDGTIVLAVDDDGPGIPAPDRERVLERFVRLDDARARDDGGSGLGLAIVAELVAAHGGVITVTASPLGGARVELLLPVFVEG